MLTQDDDPDRASFAKDVAGDDQALDFAGAFADGASESRRTGGEKQFTLNGLRCISELRTR